MTTRSEDASDGNLTQEANTDDMSEITNDNPHQQESINYSDPSFIMKSIPFEDYFEVHDNFSMTARNNMIECMCDQICFYVLCAYRAHYLSKCETATSFASRVKMVPPSIVVYGSGTVAEYVLSALADVGCAPYIKVFCRDSKSAKQWAKRGFRSTVAIKDGYIIDILLICSNLCSFSQLCRDLCQYLTPKTFIISNVFCLQRKRMYNLFGTPGIVRTHIERRGAGRHPSERNVTTRTFSAKLLASKVNGVKNLIVLLENYMIALDVDKFVARKEAMHLVVGSEKISMDEGRMRSPFKSKKRISFDEEAFSSGDESFTFSSDSDSDLSDLMDEVSKDFDLTNSFSEMDTRKSLFQIRQRSFKEDENEDKKKMEKELEKKKRRKQRKLKKYLRQQKLKKKADEDALKELQSGDDNNRNDIITDIEATSGGLTIDTDLGQEYDKAVMGQLIESPNVMVRSCSTPLVSTRQKSSPPPSHDRSSGELEKDDKKGSSSHDNNDKNILRDKVKEKKNVLNKSVSLARNERNIAEKQRQEKLDEILGISENSGGNGLFHEVVATLTGESSVGNVVKKSPFLSIISKLDQRYGEIFRKELSNHIFVIDLPSLDEVKQQSTKKRRKKTLVGNILAQRAALARRSSLLSVMPTVIKKHVGYLKSDEILNIFNSDKLSANIFNERSAMVERMNELSDDEDKDGEGDDLFFEDVPREKFRYFVLD